MYRGKLFLNNLNHPLYLLGSDRSGAGLFSTQVHHMSGELLTTLFVFFKFLVVDCSNLVKLSFVVRMFYRCLSVRHGRRGRGVAPFVWSSHTLRYQHVVQPHELRVRRVVLVQITEAESRPLLDLAENTEQSWLHPVTVESVLPRLGLVQALVGDVEDLVEQKINVRVAGTFVLRIF